MSAVTSGLATTQYRVWGVPWKVRVKEPLPLFTMDTMRLVWLQGGGPFLRRAEVGWRQVL
jgi:hypothetical protein